MIKKLRIPTPTPNPSSVDDDDKSYALAVLDSGKLLVGGYAYNGATDDFALARYDSDGTLDTTFGSGGKTTTDFGYDDVIWTMNVLESGKILVGGYAYNGIANFAMARYNSDGTLDTTFGSGGKTTTDFGYGTDKVFAVTVRGDGKLVVAGYAYADTDYDFALAMYRADGSVGPGPALVTRAVFGPPGVPHTRGTFRRRVFWR